MIKNSAFIIIADFPLWETNLKEWKRRCHYIPYRCHGRTFRFEYNLWTARGQAIRKYTKLPFDVHLMITDPDNISTILSIGGRYYHRSWEACVHLNRTIQNIKDKGIKPCGFESRNVFVGFGLGVK